MLPTLSSHYIDVGSNMLGDMGWFYMFEMLSLPYRNNLSMSILAPSNVLTGDAMTILHHALCKYYNFPVNQNFSVDTDEKLELDVSYNLCRCPMATL